MPVNVSVPPPKTELPTKEPTPEPVKPVSVKAETLPIEPKVSVSSQKAVNINTNNNNEKSEKTLATPPNATNITQNVKERDSVSPAISSATSTPQPPVEKLSTPAPASSTPSPAPPQENEVIQPQVNNNEEAPEVKEEEEEEDESKSEQPKYNYKDGFWSPINPDGKRQYDRGFLLELQNNPLSLKRPESLPNLEVVLDSLSTPGSKIDHGMYMSNNFGADMLPPNYVNVNPNYVKPTRSKIGNRPSFGGGKNVQKVMVIGLKGSSDNRLEISENAWRPKNKENSKSLSKEEKESKDVLKRMRGILNKLTPDNFGKLLENVKQLPLGNNNNLLTGVIDLIFEKAVDEQAFSTTYAKLCEELSHVVKSESKNNDAKAEKNFRFLIISRCQKEFEKDTMEEIKEKWQKNLDACKTDSEREEMRINYEELEMRLRKRSVGNIKFIGELYKVKMLTSLIMMRIIDTLLKKTDSESLECLCKLLSTIGSILEAQAAQQPKAMDELDNHFKEIQRIISAQKTTNRVRFLMMDVVDLRKNDWKARREETKPMTKAQVHEEVKKEEEELQILLNTPRQRDDRNKRNSRDNPRGMMDEGWSMVTPTRSNRPFDSARLKTFRTNQDVNVQLRGCGFGLWGRGSSGGAGQNTQDDSSGGVGNRFNILESTEGAPEDRRLGPMPPRFGPGGGVHMRPGGTFGSKSMPPPSSDKESALSAVKQMVATGN